MFESLSTRLNDVFSRLRGKGRLGPTDVDATLREIRLALLEADVNVTVVKALLARVRGRAVGAEITKSLTPGQEVIKIVHEELITTLGGAAVPLRKAEEPPLTILMVGLQGSGKTTSAVKLARLLKQRGHRPLLVAADLQRPAAVEQLITLGERIGVPVSTNRKVKPPRLVKAAMKRATSDGNDVVIVDTAGRLQVDQELMRELGDVEKAADPDEVLLVVDAMTGQDAVNVAKGFLDRVGLTGIVLSKLDGDARGGAAISVREVTGCPIKFAGVGEKLGDFEPFHPDRMASRILGMGDVLTLIEKAEDAWDVSEAEAMADKMRTASFTFEDFLRQFQQIRQIGPLDQVLAMLPGAGSMFRNVQVSDDDLGRVEAIIRSMTPEERRSPKLIDGSRKRRIAAGSGSSAQAVNGLLKQFNEAQKMMKMMAQGKSIPGLRKMR
ncbi:signal recognition particle protein [bacterium BMS3Abin02]|nr:signal recognition particle protein [bacterium BMS3Abin02]GBE22449.1 signal recognition particle protein [bacterium BMS3Bbin01]HDH25234.1 signal recognition particle protein [Actinomycetota bacterium]